MYACQPDSAGATHVEDSTAEPSYYDEDLERALADTSEDDMASSSHELTSVAAPVAPPLPAAATVPQARVKRPRAHDDDDFSGLFM